LYTFDFHQPRVDLAREEFFAHGLAELVSCQHRDVVAEGFGQDLLEKADAVFLDLPTPWLAIEHVIGVFRKSVVFLKEAVSADFRLVWSKSRRLVRL
jgi:tRNA (adenine57-N1/adenine58-N1)-methyltransferase